MGRRNESHAFRNGFVIGGLAGAGALLWNAPQSGARTREQIVEAFEGVLFKVLDMPEKLVGVRGPEITPGMEVVPPVPAAEESGTDIVIDGPRPLEPAP